MVTSHSSTTVSTGTPSAHHRDPSQRVHDLARKTERTELTLVRLPFHRLAVPGGGEVHLPFPFLPGRLYSRHDSRRGQLLWRETATTKDSLHAHSASVPSRTASHHGLLLLLLRVAHPLRRRTGGIDRVVSRLDRPSHLWRRIDSPLLLMVVLVLLVVQYFRDETHVG